MSNLTILLSFSKEIPGLFLELNHYPFHPYLSNTLLTTLTYDDIDSVVKKTNKYTNKKFVSA